MPNHDTIYFSKHMDTTIIPRYAIWASFPHLFDAKAYYELKNKDESLGLSDVESNHIQKIKSSLYEVSDRLQKGELIDIQNMPTKIYLVHDEKCPTADITVFQLATDSFVVNQACYDVFSQMNLGKTHFSKVFIYDITTDKKVSDTPYYFINIAEKREYIDTDHSSQISKNFWSPESSVFNIDFPKDFDIKLSATALEERVDIWVDPQVNESLFFSNKLVDKLLSKGIEKEIFALLNCEILEK